jgi:hypothetical protein
MIQSFLAQKLKAREWRFGCLLKTLNNHNNLVMEYVWRELIVVQYTECLQNEHLSPLLWACAAQTPA